MCVCVLNLKCKFYGPLNHFGSADKCGGMGVCLCVCKRIALENITFSLLAVKTAWLLMFGSYAECLTRH